MKRLVRRIEHLHDERRELARRGCTVIDNLATNLSPALLDAAQYWLRIELVDVEHQLRAWKERRSADRRRAWLRRYRDRYGPRPSWMST